MDFVVNVRVVGTNIFHPKFLYHKMRVKTTNIIKLTPLNPNVSLGKEYYLRRDMFPCDNKLKNIVYSDEFQQLLLTDASTKDGQDFLASYYEINDWLQMKQK